MPNPLLLIPSQLCTSAMWEYQIDALGAIADISVAEHDRGNSMSAIAASILAAAPPRFALAAHGMGGFVAFEAWRQAPERIERLALFDTNATEDSPAQSARRQGYANLVKQGDFARVIDQRIPILFHPERQDDPVLLAIARSMAEATGAEGFLRQQQAIIDRPDSRPTLPQVTCPTMVIIGRQDRITSLEDATLIADNIPRARLEVVEDSGHLVPLEQASVATRLLRHWLLDY